MEVASSLARAAGEVIRKNFSSNMAKEWKDERSPVTATDLLVNEMVLKKLRSCYPTCSILSEEGNDCLENSDNVWICDPVDGTHNFAHGIPTATFALALIQNGEPVLGIIYDPFLDRMWSAEKGKGAYVNGKRITVSKHASLKSALIGMGKMKKVFNFFPAMEEGYDKGISFITGLSTHYMAGLVAQGEFAASFFGGRPPHDMAASAIIVREAGGVVTDLHGNVPKRYDTEMDGQLCSNGILHEELLSLIQSGKIS